MEDADSAFLYPKDEEDEDLTEELEARLRKTPPKKVIMRHQEYRTVTLGPEDMLKNGKMVQISISDAFNKDKFYPTDKIILCMHQGKYYALGSFCGFDFTNLATGALIGEKMICPTCGSNYDITSGIVD